MVIGRFVNREVLKTKLIRSLYTFKKINKDEEKESKNKKLKFNFCEKMSSIK